MVVDLCHKFAQHLAWVPSEFTVPSHDGSFFFSGTMPSADFCPLSPRLHRDLPTQSAYRTDLPGYLRALSPHLPALSTLDSFDNHGFRLDPQTHPLSLASLRVRVPQAKVLPPASFRFHLTVDTLALS